VVGAGSGEAIEFGSGRVTVALVEGADPVMLMAAVAALSPRQVQSLDEAESEAFTVACERVTAAVHARQSLAMDTLAGRVEDRLQSAREARPLPMGVPSPDVHSVVASMLAPALHCATPTVRRRLEADRWLVCAAETTFAAQWQGELERRRADVVVEALRDVAPDLREGVEALVLETRVDDPTGELSLVSDTVRQMSRAELARRATRVAEELDPGAHEEAARRAYDAREVVVRPDRRHRGMARWSALLPADVSKRAFAAVDGLARQYARAHPGTPIDGHRADALADLVLGNAEVQTVVELVVPVVPPPAPAGSTPTIDSASTGRSDTGGSRSGSAPAGDPSTHGRTPAGSPDGAAPTDGPITRGSSADAAATDGSSTGEDYGDASNAPNPLPVKDSAEVDGVTGDMRGCCTGPRDELTAAGWIVPGVVDDPRHGALLPVGVAELLSDPNVLIRLSRLDPDGSVVQDPKRYRPSASTRRKVRSRDETCRFPGCSVPAARCDLDHVIPFPRGRTVPDNLVCLCRTHHIFKHHGGWRAALAADGAVTWTAPDGRTWVTAPQPPGIPDSLGLSHRVDPDVAHAFRSGWFPGLPPGMSLADLVEAELALPDEAPEQVNTPPPPDDWLSLDAVSDVDTEPPCSEPPMPDPAWPGPAWSHPAWLDCPRDPFGIGASPLEALLAFQLALAA
jgi:hypothetical protein